ncbi:hypothetical protein [Shewanella sp. 10N.286.52.A9]|uniref:hypothetical protein n=1 Tax=Shewanella sp. 10N.286.52.A9 TaxID=3229711 RepID=UPI00354D10E0
MKSTRFAESLITFFTCSPLLGVTYVLNLDPKALVFWLIYSTLGFIYRKKILASLKIGSFPYYFSTMLILFVLFAIAGNYGKSNDVDFDGLIFLLLFPLMFFVLIYTKKSNSFKKAVQVFCK